MKIGVDVDGVLADFDSGFRDLSRKLVGKPTDPNLQPTDWGMKNYGFTGDEEKLVWNAVGNSNNFWVDLMPLPTTSKLPALCSKHDVTFITNRKVTQGLRVPEQTAIWLHRHFGLAYPTVILAKNKGQVSAALGIDTFIDDNVENCEDLNTHINPVYLCDAPWNRHYTGAAIKRVSDFDTFASLFL